MKRKDFLKDRNKYLKKKYITIIPVSVILLLSLSGCLEIFSGNDGRIVYQSHPTKISYDISYGYKINCSGSGKYSIKYNLDKPELIYGDVLSIVPKDNNYSEKTLATYNEVMQWDFVEYDENNFNLGLTATIESESYIVPDLSGSNALDIEEINNKYPSLVQQYCIAQSNDTKIFINPQDTLISSLANSIKEESGTNNSFIIAKDFFRWLKQYTTYQIHSNNNVQPANFTLQCKTGDCDDLSFLYISMCRSIGIPSRFIRGFLLEEENAIPHAWVEVFVGGNIGKSGWIPVECAGVSSDIKTEINQNFGVESAQHLRLFTDDGSEESLNVSLATLYLVKYNPNIQINTESYAEINNYKELVTKELVIDENNMRFYQ
jgi:transglutaminase-like putative cysteine protease